MRKPKRPKFPKIPKSKNKEVLKRYLEKVSSLRSDYDSKLKIWEKANKEITDLKTKVAKARSI